MLEIFRIWRKDKEMPFFKELKSYFLSPRPDEETPLEDQLRYENYFQPEIAAEVPDIIMNRQVVQIITKNLNQEQVIEEA